MEYVFKRLTKERLKDVLYLIKAIYNRTDSLQEISKKFDTIAWGVENVGYVAYSEEGEPAGFYGVFPIQVIYNGKIHLAAQSGNTMTHPNHRRKGLFTRLAKKTYDLAQSEGIEFVFGFPNYNSYPGFVKKLNWEHKENIRAYNFFVPTIPLVELCRVLPMFTEIYKLYVRKVISLFSIPYDSFMGSSESAKEPRLNHGRAFFDYKKTPEKFIIEANGKKALIKAHGTLGIGDMQFQELSDIKKIIRKIRIIAMLCGICRVTCYLSPNCSLNKAMAQLYTSKEGLPIGYVNFTFPHSVADIQFTYCDFDTY